MNLIRKTRFCIPAKYIILIFSEDDDENSEHSSPNVSAGLLNPTMMNRMSPGVGTLPSGSPSNGLPGMPPGLPGMPPATGQMNTGLPTVSHDGQITGSAVVTTDVTTGSAGSTAPPTNGEATPESAGSPIQRFQGHGTIGVSSAPGPIPSSLTSVQSTIEKTFNPASIPGYSSVEFGHSPISTPISPALWPSGWPQHAYYGKQ